MKKVLAPTLLLALASNAAAHTSSLPHTHEGGSTNWLPAVACLAALVAGGLYLFARSRKARSAK